LESVIAESRLPDSKVKSERVEQHIKHHGERVSTDEGIRIDASEEQYAKPDPSSIESLLDGIHAK
jgi:hypothetical protein